MLCLQEPTLFNRSVRDIWADFFHMHVTVQSVQMSQDLKSVKIQILSVHSLEYVQRNISPAPFPCI